MVVRQMRSVDNPLLLGKVLIEWWGGEGGELGFRKSRRVAGEVTELGRGRGERVEIVGGFRAGHVEFLGKLLLLELTLIGRTIAGRKVVCDCIGRRSKHGVDGPAREAASHEPESVHPLLLAPLVLEPHLDHPHRQLGVLRQLLSHHSGRLWRLVENRSQHFQLLGLDGCSWASPLPVLAFFLLILFVIFLLIFLLV